MKTSELVELKRKLEVMEDDILNVKGDEYSVGNEDRLKFFKDYADKLGVSTQKVCSVFLLKHINSILKYAKTGKDSGEGIISRINDARNYLLFMAALYNDSKNTDNKNTDNKDRLYKII